LDRRQELVDGAGWVLAFTVLMMSQKCDVFTFIGRKAGYPIHFSRRIGPGKWHAGEVGAPSRLVAAVFGEPIRIAIVWIPMLRGREQIWLLADLEGK
jgi:hypothetical protein